VADVHRALALLTVLTMGGHLLLVFLDQFTKFNVLEVLVPFVTSYRPFWTGLGIIAAYAVVAVFASFYIRGNLGYRMWRYIHYATFGIFLAALFHGTSVGTDASAIWARLLFGGSAVTVALAACYRLVRGTGPKPLWFWQEDATEMPMLRGVLAGCCLAAVIVTILVWPPSFTKHTDTLTDQPPTTRAADSTR
jgi:sulfoxide reductase heme-binding subunit YedZ